MRQHQQSAISNNHCNRGRMGYRFGNNWKKLITGKEGEPLVHGESVHSDSFIPLPIADAYDPERSELAAKLNSDVQAKIANMKELQKISSQDAKIDNNPLVSSPSNGELSSTHFRDMVAKKSSGKGIEGL